MTFVMVVVAAAGLALANTASVVKSGVENRYSIQIADGAAKASAAIEAARAQPGVVRAEQVPPEELRRTLQRWLGPAANEADLPIPVIVEVDLGPGANPSGVGAGIERRVPGARFVAHRASLAPLLLALRGATMLALALVMMIGLASAAAIVLAARGALDTHRATIEVMHGVGATDAQVVRLFLSQIAVDALLGGLAGAAVAGVILLFMSGSAHLATSLAGAPLLGLGDAVLLAFVPLAVAIITTLVARAALVRALRERL
jgi:cell division transport system permease protein